MFVNLINAGADTVMTYKARTAWVYYNLQVFTINQAFYYGQVTANIRILMGYYNFGDFSRVDNVYDLSHDSRKVRNWSGVYQYNFMIISQNVWITVEIGFFIMKANPENIS